MPVDMRISCRICARCHVHYYGAHLLGFGSARLLAGEIWFADCCVLHYFFALTAN